MKPSDPCPIACLNRKKGILEIGRMPNLRDRKTIRQYLKPLISEGWIVRMVYEKPNSRNRKYLRFAFSAGPVCLATAS